MFLVKILKIWEWVFGLFLGFFCCCCWWFLIFRVRICELKWREHNLFIFFLLVGKKPQNIFALNLHFPFHTLTVTEWMPIAENLFTLRLNSYKFKYRNRVEVPELINRNILVLTGCPEKQEYYHCYCKIPHPKLFLEPPKLTFLMEQRLGFCTSTLLALTTHHCDFCLDFFFSMNILQVGILSYTWSMLKWVSELCRKWSVQIHGMAFRRFNFHL